MFYLMTNIINGKKYIGRTNNIKRRIGDHISHIRKGSRSPLYDAIREHGIENFTVEEVFPPDSIKDNKQAEQWLIEKYNSIVHGYNKIKGGGGRPGDKSVFFQSRIEPIHYTILDKFRQDTGLSNTSEAFRFMIETFGVMYGILK